MLTRRALIASAAVTSALSACATPSSSAAMRGPGRGPWKLSTPEAHGLSLDALNAAADDLAAAGERQGLVVIRHGELAFERYWANDWARATPDWKNVSFSSGKSWGATMVGRAVTLGHLKVDDLTSEYHPGSVSGFRPQTTIRHLLTMTSGGTMNMKPSSKPPKKLDDTTPPGPGVEYEWYKEAEKGTPPGYGLTIQPGEQFFYDGAPADHLADIISAATGRSSHRFMMEEIVGPLGCENFAYQREGVDRKDNIRIGGSITLSCRDMARLGQLYLNRGAWGGRQLVDADYIRDATNPSAHNPAYGYLWWLNRSGRTPNAPRSMFFAAGARTILLRAARARHGDRHHGLRRRPAYGRECMAGARALPAGRLIRPVSKEPCMRLTGCLLAAAALAACASATLPPAGDGRARTTSGMVQGETADGVVSFKGVPYAQPPVGALRWAPPQPVSWTGVRNATNFASPCLQPTNPDGRTANGGGVAGVTSEDCLYLNIWTPANAERAPVMLWLYGGGGTMGAGSVATYDGTRFARDGVMLVTINYRHGALAGFAHPAIAKANGAPDANFHLLDAIAALKWVKANAGSFGGDAGNVTLFGESAGATMTANLATSPQARGLFQKAIIESTGSLPTPGTPLPRALELGAAFATAHGLPGREASLEQLRAIPADAIMADTRTRSGLRTVIDGTTKTQSIIDAFASGAALDVPMIIGTNSDEGRLSGTQRVATYAMSGAPVWQYFFDYVPEVRRADNPNGAPHAAELPFAFDTLAIDRRIAGKVTAEDQRVADLVHGCWVAFAKQGASARTIACPGFAWPSRTAANNQTVAIFKATPALGQAADLRSPPNGAAPGPTSRDAE